MTLNGCGFRPHPRWVSALHERNVAHLAMAVAPEHDVSSPLLLLKLQDRRAVRGCHQPVLAADGWRRHDCRRRRHPDLEELKPLGLHHVLRPVTGPRVLRRTRHETVVHHILQLLLAGGVRTHLVHHVCHTWRQSGRSPFGRLGYRQRLGIVQSDEGGLLPRRSSHSVKTTRGPEAAASAKSASHATCKRRRRPKFWRLDQGRASPTDARVPAITSVLVDELIERLRHGRRGGT
jgi:hypothetical protein